MNSNRISIRVLFIFILTLLLTVPAFAQEDDPQERETTAEVAGDGDGHSDDDGHHADDDDGHSDDNDHHADDDDGHHAGDDEGYSDGSDHHADEVDYVDHHGDGSGNTGIVLGGILGAILLAAGAAFMFSPRPTLLVLSGLALIGATGVIHLMVGSNWGDTLLLLNGIGYLGLGIIWALPKQFVPNQKRILAIVLAVYTLITILGYFLTHDHYGFVALLTKAIEVPLLIILGISAFSTNAVSADKSA